MARIKASCFSMSIDGFGAGPNQSIDQPLGVGGPKLFQWFFPTRTFKAMHSQDGGGESGIDDRWAARGFENVGAWILGRNMFGPVRGPWPDESWKGWWGDSPPYHCPVFVLTHHARKPIEMIDGTIFHFVTDGLRAALGRALEAAHGKDVRIGGGVATVRQYLRERLIDEVHIALSPVLMGAGELLFDGLNMSELGYICEEHEAGEAATHVLLRRR